MKKTLFFGGLLVATWVALLLSWILWGWGPDSTAFVLFLVFWPIAVPVAWFLNRRRPWQSARSPRASRLREGASDLRLRLAGSIRSNLWALAMVLVLVEAGLLLARQWLPALIVPPALLVVSWVYTLVVIGPTAGITFHPDEIFVRDGRRCYWRPHWLGFLPLGYDLVKDTRVRWLPWLPLLSPVALVVASLRSDPRWLLVVPITLIYWLVWGISGWRRVAYVVTINRIVTIQPRFNVWGLSSKSFEGDLKSFSAGMLEERRTVLGRCDTFDPAILLLGGEEHVMAAFISNGRMFAGDVEAAKVVLDQRQWR